ncbi:MAG: DNA-binding protein WhiA [Syntrophomonadaceae bacterium]|nr:DNA-binding protein WhiA [Syntrophomonadaceae bacterium]
MSFSNDVRYELTRVMPEKDCCRKAELSALLASSARWVEAGDGSDLIVQADNAATARKIYKLLKDVYGLQAAVSSETKKYFGKNHIYEVSAHIDTENEWIQQELMPFPRALGKPVASSLLGKSCCKRAYLRGTFLSRGFVNRPEGDYHLELTFNDEHLAAEVQKLLARFELHAHVFERKNSTVVYIKESEKIADFLRVVGASNALLEFENVRIIKSMRNNVNRQVNCETANLAKTIDASLRQTDLIEALIARGGMESLPSNLRELAMLRIEYPDNSLQELGEMLQVPLSKSGVAYRMRKLERLAEEWMDSVDS